MFDMANDIGGISSEGGSMRAVATLLIIVLVLAVLYFSGILGGDKEAINGNIKTLTVPNTNK
jgi:hypothetical protein